MCIHKFRACKGYSAFQNSLPKQKIANRLSRVQSGLVVKHVGCVLKPLEHHTQDLVCLSGTRAVDFAFVFPALPFLFVLKLQRTFPLRLPVGSKQPKMAYCNSYTVRILARELHFFMFVPVIACCGLFPKSPIK